MDASPPDDSIRTIGSAPIKMNATRQSVVVKAPIDQVYEQLSRVEDLPKFITPLRNVRRLDDSHFSYSWHPNGNEQQGVFHIVLRVPGRRIAWGSMSDGFMSGVVCFEPVSSQETEVTLKIRSIFDPPNFSRRVEEYLGNFKRLVEGQEDPKTSKSNP
jgi:uncharacterized membrane protein